MNKYSGFHPFLVATYPVLFLYHVNAEELSLDSLIWPLVILLVLTALLRLVTGLFLKNGYKGALITSVFIILFFSFGHTYEFTTYYLNWDDTPLRMFLCLMLFVTLFLLFLVPVAMTKRDLKNATMMFNLFSLILVASITAQILFDTVKFKRGTESYFEPYKAVAKEKKLPDYLPNIYYIIPDEYANSRTLKEIHKFDNGEFMDYLRKSGFSVLERSHSNYMLTDQSLASSLNMEYIEIKNGKVPDPYKMIWNNGTVRFLKKYGYEFVNISSGSGPTNYVKGADRNIFYVSGVNEFTIMLAHSSVLRFFDDKLYDVKRIKVLSGLRKLEELAKEDGPRFVLAHFGSPHPPHVFGPDGERKKPKKMSPFSYNQPIEGYFDEIRFMNKRMEKITASILKNSKVPPVIILQSDHGSLYTMKHHRFREADDRNIKERSRILNAIYLPEGCRKNLYDNMTPVNTFRVTLNCIFNAGYELKKDRIFWSGYDNAWDFREITEKMASD